jgi:hypothetical protein
MIDHEMEFGWLRVGHRVNAVAEDDRCCVVMRFANGQLGVIWGPDSEDAQSMPEEYRIRAILHRPDASELEDELRVVRDKEAALRAELAGARVLIQQIAAERERFHSELCYAQIAAQAQIEQLRKDLDMARRDALTVLLAYEDRLPVHGDVLFRIRGYRRLLDGWKTIQEMADQAASAKRKDPA